MYQAGVCATFWFCWWTTQSASGYDGHCTSKRSKRANTRTRLACLQCSDDRGTVANLTGQGPGHG